MYAFLADMELQNLIALASLPVDAAHVKELAAVYNECSVFTWDVRTRVGLTPFCKALQTHVMWLSTPAGQLVDKTEDGVVFMAELSAYCPSVPLAVEVKSKENLFHEYEAVYRAIAKEAKLRASRYIRHTRGALSGVDIYLLAPGFNVGLHF